MLHYLDNKYYFKVRRDGCRDSDPEIKREYSVALVSSYIFYKNVT